MRKRLKQFGFDEDRINAMIHPQPQKQPEEKKYSIAQHPFQTASQPTYPKISREHHATKTLKYYDTPYEFE